MSIVAVVPGALVGCGLSVVLLPRLMRNIRSGVTAGIRNSRLIAAERARRIHASDLALVGWSPTDLVTRRLLGIVGGAVGCAMVGTAYGSGQLVLLLAFAGATTGFAVPALLLRSRARSRRRTFVHSFSAYLDLVNVLLAGGAGIETALTVAADVGDGWAFATLRSTLTRARLSRRSPWTELRQLGLRWGIDELVEVAGSMTLSGDHGARIRSSLAARADSMRARQVAEIEASAQSATERMGVPMMMLFVGFMALLGYPALQTVVMNM